VHQDTALGQACGNTGWSRDGCQVHIVALRTQAVSRLEKFTTAPNGIESTGD
jgi:hypothetical protein